MSKKFCPLLYRGVYLQYSTPFFSYSDLNPFINLFIIEMDGSFHCRVRDGLFYLVIAVIFSKEVAFIIVQLSYCCMPKKSLPILYRKLIFKFGQDILDNQ